MLGYWARINVSHYNQTFIGKIVEVESDNMVIEVTPIDNIGCWEFDTKEDYIKNIKISKTIEGLVEPGDIIKWKNISFKNSEEYTRYVRKIEWDEEDKCYNCWSDDSMYIELGSKYEHIKITKIIPHENLNWQEFKYDVEESN